MSSITWLVRAFRVFTRLSSAGNHLPNRFGRARWTAELPVQGADQQGQNMPSDASGGASGRVAASSGGADGPDAAWARLASNPAREQGGEKKPAAMRPGQRAVPDKRD